MLRNLFVIVLFFLFTAPVHAEVYKCNEEGATRYSTTPCDNQLIDLELGEDSYQDENIMEEQFFVSLYPGWKNGWVKSKDLKLERFFEVVYEPLQPTELQKLTRINQQKLTNLPQSMSVQRFALSVEDIIESICARAIIYPQKITSVLPDNVYYGQYACSYRRDTKQGEVGFYKIIRGENSIYMVAVTWGLDTFNLDNGDPLAMSSSAQMTKQISLAKSYLKDKVKLCHAGNCF